MLHFQTHELITFQIKPIQCGLSTHDETLNNALQIQSWDNQSYDKKVCALSLNCIYSYALVVWKAINSKTIGLLLANDFFLKNHLSLIWQSFGQKWPQTAVGIQIQKWYWVTKIINLPTNYPVQTLYFYSMTNCRNKDMPR